jgi:4-hydroxyphenylpyruvate dioxygenase
MNILNQGFDHVEFVLRDRQKLEAVFQRTGFEKIGARTAGSLPTVAYAQGKVRILLTEPKGASPAQDFLNQQGEGICCLAIEVDDAEGAFHHLVKRGARPAMEPAEWACDGMTVVRAEVWTPGNLRYALIERRGEALSLKNTRAFPLDLDLSVSRLESPSPLGIQSIDHLTNNVPIGTMRTWVDYYNEVFGFKVTRQFDIRTGRTGLLSEVVESPDRKIKVPVNEATEPASQVQEFVDRLKGSGVQHLAFLTKDLQHTVKSMRQEGFQFLTVPHTYYEAVPARVPGVTENLNILEDLGVLLDGDASGYLLQIFSQEILGPFFFEFIQRKSNEGFGEGNFRALFEAIERDQVRRGVLK